MGKTRTGKVAIGCTVIGFIFVLIAFTTPNWLQTDGKKLNPTFHRIGLWRFCVQDFEDQKHHYDVKFNGCNWIFQEEHYIIHDFLLPSFFVATIFMFTLCFTLLLVGLFLTLLYTLRSRQHEKYLFLLWTNGSILTLSGICGIIAVLCFGGRGDYRDWMPDWQHNDVGWSYALAVIGSVITLAAGILFLIEGRRFRKRVEKLLGDDRKTHTTI